jgi:hypothetical protein
MPKTNDAIPIPLLISPSCLHIGLRFLKIHRLFDLSPQILAPLRGAPEPDTCRKAGGLENREPLKAVRMRLDASPSQLV